MTVISFRHDFIFIKTAKTAGTSIEADLSAVVEPEAVVTPILPEVPGHLARNHLAADGTPLFYNHMPATEIRQALGPERFASMFKFCVEREPVEKCISHFHMLRNSALHNPDGAYDLDWPGYVAAGHFPIDTAKYAEGGGGARRLIVDRVLRYDDLARALTALLAGRGLPGFRLTSRAKSEYSRPRLVTPAEVTQAQRRRVYEAFEESLQLAGIDWSVPPRA